MARPRNPDSHRSKKRPDPRSEGSLQDIFSLLVAPLMPQKPIHYTLQEWLEVLFHNNERDISRWEVLREFIMPGLFYAAGRVKWQGVGYRYVAPTTLLWVRTDERNPGVVDVEFAGGQGGKSQVFELTKTEWDWVKLHCKEIKERRELSPKGRKANMKRRVGRE